MPIARARIALSRDARNAYPKGAATTRCTMISPLPAITSAALPHLEAAKGNALKKIEYFVSDLLDGGKKSFLNGKSLSAADLYAYIVLSWTGFLGIQLPAGAQAYFDGLKALEAIQKGHAVLSAAA